MVPSPSPTRRNMIPPDKPRPITALLSSLISQIILLLLLHLSPSPNTPNPNSNYNSTLFLLLHHLITSSEIAASLSLLPFTRKRKRTTHSPRLDSPIPRNPDSFKQHFMMTSSTFEWLSTLLEPLLECRDPVNSPIDLPPEMRLGIGLYRLATGSDYPEISNRFGISEPVARFCVKQLCRVLCTNFRFWVGFPCQTELDEVSTSFQKLTGMPNCCGVINCTRFKILRKNKKDNNLIEEESVAAQIVVDSSSRILSIVAGFNGQKGNFQILKSSTLYKDIVDSKKLLNSQHIQYIDNVAIPQYIVGDVGCYPLLPWLIVPFRDPMSNSCEERFNLGYDLMRVSGLRTIASLRSWGVLSRPIEAELKTAVAYIGACSILHNCLLMRDDFSALCDGLDNYSLYDQKIDWFRDVTLEEDMSDNKAFEIRRALAARAREVGRSDPISSVKPQQD